MVTDQMSSDSDEQEQTSEEDQMSENKEKEASDDNGSEEPEDLELDASDTESDEEEFSEANRNEESSKTQTEVKVEKIIQKYQQRQGKQMYVRFPSKLPLDEREFEEKAQALSPLIVKAHKPRQKYARFCLVDFNSVEDRNTTLKKIRNAAKLDDAFKGIVVSIPRTENEEFLKELTEKKLKALENKKAKARLRRVSKLAHRTKNFTSSIVVSNLPKSASMLDLRNVFPNAVDIQMKPGKGKMHGTTVAAVTLPSTMEARVAFKQTFSLRGTKLAVRFDKPAIKSKQTKARTNIKTKLQQVQPKVVVPTSQIEQCKKAVKRFTPVVLQNRTSKRDALAKAIVTQKVKSKKIEELGNAAVVSQEKKSQKLKAENGTRGPPAKKSKCVTKVAGTKQPMVGKRKQMELK